MIEFSEQQKFFAESCFSYLEEGMFDVVPAKNKKTGKIEVLLIAKEPIDNDEDHINILALGQIFDRPGMLDRYEMEFEFVQEDRVVYTNKPWWKFWSKL